MSVFFNGRLLTTPTTASVVNDDAMANRNLTVGNVVAFIGKSTGGEPNVALRFGNPTQAKLILRSGELLDAVVKAFDPSAQTPAPSTVIALRVNPALQSSADVAAAGEVGTVLTLSSVNYGQADNQIKYKIESGTTTGKRFTVQRGTESYSQDNIARQAFSIRYSGSESTATATIDEAGLTLAYGSTTLALDFADFATVTDLVDRINVVTGFAAAVLADSYNSPTANGLDFITTQDVKTATSEAVTAIKEAIEQKYSE